jgi:hypothetical protein
LPPLVPQEEAIRDDECRAFLFDEDDGASAEDDVIFEARAGKLETAVLEDVEEGVVGGLVSAKEGVRDGDALSEPRVPVLLGDQVEKVA